MKLATALTALLLILGSISLRAKEAPLKEGDVVGVNVFGEDSLSGAFAIGPKGTIVFPLLGDIAAKDKSTDEIALQIKTALEKDYIRSAQVVVSIAEEAVSPPHSVTVIGQVTTPQQVNFPAGDSLDIFSAIASAGGLSERANRSRIELKRPTGKELQSQILSLDDDRVFKLKDGDTLIVSALPLVDVKTLQATVTVIGQVKIPGNITINPKQPLDLIAAIAAAGGFTDKARPSKVIVRRGTKAGIKVYEFNVTKMQRDDSEPFLLFTGDLITVPESLF